MGPAEVTGVLFVGLQHGVKSTSCCYDSKSPLMEDAGRTILYSSPPSLEPLNVSPVTLEIRDHKGLHQQR